MGTKTAIISIEDLSSDAIPVLDRAFHGVLGVESVDYNLDRNVAVVEFDPAKTKVDDLLRTVLKEGYKVI